jgi:hypothetical protein
MLLGVAALMFLGLALILLSERLEGWLDRLLAPLARLAERWTWEDSLVVLWLLGCLAWQVVLPPRQGPPPLWTSGVVPLVGGMFLGILGSAVARTYHLKERFHRWMARRQSPDLLRRAWDLSLRRDRVLHRDLERKGQAASVLANRHYSKEDRPEESLERVLLSPQGMLGGSRLAKLLHRKVQDKAYLKKVLPKQ